MILDHTDFILADMEHTRFIATFDSLMKERGLNLRDLERATGIKYHRSNQWRRSNVSKPNGEDLASLARFFAVEPSYLLTGKEAGPSDLKDATAKRISQYEEDQLRELEVFLDYLEARRAPQP